MMTVKAKTAEQPKEVPAPKPVVSKPVIQGPSFYTEDLNQQNIDVLLSMGYDYELVVQAFRHLRDEA